MQRQQQQQRAALYGQRQQQHCVVLDLKWDYEDVRAADQVDRGRAW
jgi:hypothetical protein